MKCQHCGINFDDSERECPICGARAGSRGRLGEAQKTIRARSAERTQAKTASYTPAKRKPKARKARASVKPIRENKKSGKGKIAAIAAVVVLIINFLPALTDLFDTVWYEFSDSISAFEDLDSDYSGSEDVLYVPGEHYTYDADHYQYVYAALHDLTGGYAAGVLSDGSTIEISVEEGEMGDYTLIMQDGTGTYLETGYTWCSYNYPEEEAYNEAYPPYQYDCFTLSLDVYDCSYDSPDGSIPERYALDEYEERWFLLYYAPETGEVVLEDLDGSGLFGADEFLTLQPLENG